jgi:hypothetical protein
VIHDGWGGLARAELVEVTEELGLPCEISVASGAETTDRKLPSDAHAPRDAKRN